MRHLFALVVLFMGAAAALPARAEFIFRMGNTVYVDGKAYDWEEWKKIRDDPERLSRAANVQPGPSEKVSPARSENSALKPAADGPRAASCLTAGYRDEFPADEERFQCSAALGALTREEILRAGWKVDLIEKIPSPPGEAAQSARGLPVYRYKLVISR